LQGRYDNLPPGWPRLTHPDRSGNAGPEARGAFRRIVQPLAKQCSAAQMDRNMRAPWRLPGGWKRTKRSCCWRRATRRRKRRRPWACGSECIRPHPPKKLVRKPVRLSWEIRRALERLRARAALHLKGLGSSCRADRSPGHYCSAKVKTTCGLLLGFLLPPREAVLVL
jgi:hypothetical protein